MWVPMLSAGLITGGLTLDIVGAILIFKFVLPPKVGGGFLMLEGDEEKEAREMRRYNRLGKLGVGLLILGFGLQIVGVWARFIPSFLAQLK